MTPWIFVTGVTAGEILRAESEGEPTLAEEIEGIMETQLLLSTSPRITVKDFLISFNKPGEDTFAPVIKIREEEEPPEEDLFTDISEGEPKRFIVIEGAAVFSRGKLAGYLTVPENKSIVKGNEVSGTVNLEGKTPVGDGILIYKSHYVTVEDNVVDNNEHAGVRVTAEYRYDREDDWFATNNSVINNEITNNYYGVLIQEGAEDTEVEDNYYEGNTEDEKYDY